MVVMGVDQDVSWCCLVGGGELAVCVGGGGGVEKLGRRPVWGKRKEHGRVSSMKG